MQVIEFAEILDVPILKAGTHHSQNAGDVVITPEALENILEGSIACKDIIKESIDTGFYRGNEQLHAPYIPGIINFHHNTLFDDTIKARVKQVDWEFGAKEIDGERWLTKSFYHVPTDVAKSIQDHYQGRSVELIPLTDPRTGKQYPMVVRSTAFLDSFRLPTQPAVKGQRKNLTVKLSQGETPVIVLFSGTQYQQPTEGEHLMDKEQEDVLEQPDNLPERKEALIKELQAKKSENEAVIKELQAAQAQAQQAVLELQAKQDAAEVREYLMNLGHQIIHDGQGVPYQVSASFLEVVEPMISGAKHGSVIELADGAHPTRATLEAAFTSIVELAGKSALLVPVKEMGAMIHHAPESKQQSLLQRAQELQKAEGISYDQALLRVQAEG